MLKKVVLIAASTGGPGELEKILKKLVLLRECSIVIAQHMAKEFLPSFAKRLGEHTTPKVHLIEDGSRLNEGEIFVADAITTLSSDLRFIKRPSDSSSIYNPSIDAILGSFAPHAQDLKILCVVLTGIGSDGFLGAYALSQEGVRVLTQSSDEAIVDGMPARIRDGIKEAKVLKTEEIITEIVRFCSV